MVHTGPVVFECEIGAIHAPLVPMVHTGPVVFECEIGAIHDLLVANRSKQGPLDAVFAENRPNVFCARIGQCSYDEHQWSPLPPPCRSSSPTVF